MQLRPTSAGRHESALRTLNSRSATHLGRLLVRDVSFMNNRYKKLMISLEWCHTTVRTLTEGLGER